MPFREHQVSQCSCIVPREVATKLIYSVRSGLVLEKVCEYFYYNEKHKNSKDVPDLDIPAELCLELLMAADYLNGAFVLRAGDVYTSLHLLTFSCQQFEPVR